MSLVARSAMRSNSGSSGYGSPYVPKPMTCSDAKELACDTWRTNPKFYGADDREHVEQLCKAPMGGIGKSTVYKDCKESKKKGEAPEAWLKRMEAPENTTGGRRRRKSRRKSRKKRRRSRKRTRRRKKRKRKHTKKRR